MKRRTRRRLAVLVAIASVAAVALAGSQLLREQPLDNAVSRSIASLDLQAPETVAAGEPFDVTINGIDAATTTVNIDVISSWGTRRLAATASAGTAVVRIASELTQQSGVLTLVASATVDQGRTTVMVTPGPAVDDITPLAGPRSMVADTEHWTMVVQLARDRFGNAIAEGTPVAVVARRPDGSVDTLDTTVQHLLAWVRLYSKTLAGRSTVRVDAQGATGAEVDVLEVAGPPVPFSIQGPELAGRADGRGLVAVTTDVLRDRYDNMLNDGTGVVFVAETTEGITTLTGATIAGKATVYLESPTLPGTMLVHAYADGVESKPLLLVFKGDVSRLDVSTTRVPDGVRVDVGPVISSLGGFVPDGTKVTVTSTTATATVQLFHGMATVTLPAAPGTAIDVSLLGTTRTVEAP